MPLKRVGAAIKYKYICLLMHFVGFSPFVCTVYSFVIIFFSPVKLGLKEEIIEGKLEMALIASSWV
jgi:hypothetical protein